MIATSERPLLVIVSAPSGAGKSTLCEMMLERHEKMVYSVSCTTRKPRAGEIEGKSYFFVDETEFRRGVDRGEFLEYAEVHGAMYGTLHSTVRDAMAEGSDIILDIDVQGAAQVRRQVAELPENDILRQGYVDVFIAPPSMDELRSRLTGRGKDSEEVIEGRLKQAESEMNERTSYQYLVINDDVEKCAKVLDAIVVAEHHRTLKE